MKRVRIKVLAIAIVGAVISALLLTHPDAASATQGAAQPVHPGHPARQMLKAPMHGKPAVQALGDNLGTAAAINGRTPASLKKLLTADPTMWLDKSGRLFVKEELPTAADRAAALTTGSANVTPSYALSPTQTFALHSDPGSQHTIYLDFVGATIPAGTFWTDGNASPPAPVGRYAPWSIDSNPAFSTTELADIYEVWRRVAEHYAAFDVDVTTQAPSEAALVRSSSSDQTYGDRVLFANTMLDGNPSYVSTADAWTAVCSQQCAGVATIGTITEVGKTATDEHFQPAWVFTAALGGYSNMAFPKWMADDAAHEVGHTFGLTHQGTSSKPCPTTVSPAGCGYFDGYSAAGSEPQSWLWGPLMGDPYAAAVSQWAHGEYPDANNAQDELATIIQSAPLKAASAGSTWASGVALPANGATGAITSSADHEYYSLGTCTGSVSVTGTPATLGPDVNVQLTLLDGSGSVVPQAPHAALSLDPTSTDIEPLASGMSHTVSTTGAAGHYYLEVSGGGSYADGASGATDATSGFSSYGSIGTYSLSGATGCQPPVTPPSQPSSLQLNAGCGGQVLTWKPPVDTGNASIIRYQVSVDSGAWTSMSTARSAYFTGITGGHTYAVRAVNSAGPGSVSSATIPGAVGGLAAQYDAANSTSSQDAYQILWSPPAGGNPLVVEGYTVSAQGFSGSTTHRGVELTVSSGYQPTMTVTPFNAAGKGTGTSVVLTPSGSTGNAGSPPTTTAYTRTPTPYCPAVPSAPRSVHVVRGTSGGALTTTGSWVKPSSGQPAVNTYSVRVDTRNRAGRITATHYYSTSRTSLVIKGASGYTYRIRVRAHNATGWGAWSGFTAWVAPR